MPRRILPPPGKANRPAEIGQSDQVTGVRGALLTYAVPVTILIMAMLYSTRLFIVQQGEALALEEAAHPLSTILSLFRSGFGGLAPSPLYLAGLHFWLRVTGGDFFWLRIPSAFFYMAGLCILARCAYYWAKEQSATMLLLLAAFWPYGFHYGTLLTWYSFAFLVIAALTLAYLSFQTSAGAKAWYAFCALGLILLYTTAVGWILLILLCIDDVLRKREQGSSVATRWLATFAFLAAGYASLWASLARTVHRGAAAQLSSLAHVRALAIDALYHIYVLLAGESIAPWSWRFGVPMALAVLACLVLGWLSLRADIRRFFVYAGVLLVFLDLAGILHGQQLMLVAPWFLLALAVGFSSVENRFQKRALLIALVVIAGLAWFGVYNRSYYATGDFYEPWPGVAGGAGLAVRQGGNVISNSPQFFFYLTYSLEEPKATPWRYVGSLPESVHDAHVWGPAEWEAAGRPLVPYMLWVHSNTSEDAQGIEEAGAYLDQHCGGRLNRSMGRDPGYPWKQKIEPRGAPATPWLIETHQYTCGEPPASEAPPASAPAGAPTAPQIIPVPRTPGTSSR